MAQQQTDTGIVVVNARPHVFDDLYHQLLQASWLATMLVIGALFLFTNTLFAIGYLIVGGIARARPGSFEDAFFFSVQTLGTIGYGEMHPVTRAANLLVTAESIAAVAVGALSTGLVFSKFSMPTARIAFSREATIHLMDGVRSLVFRIANERGNYVVEATIRVSLIRKERTSEGVSFWRMHDLSLVRDRSQALGRSWTVVHKITPSSPLYGATHESLIFTESELTCSVVGIDGTSAQTVHARHVYDGERDVRFGVRHADMLISLPDGTVQLDYAKFNDLVDAPLD